MTLMSQYWIARGERHNTLTDASSTFIRCVVAAVGKSNPTAKRLVARRSVS